MASSMSEARSRIPVPDPTERTTQQADKGVEALRELIEARLDGMDKALDLMQTQASKVPSSTDIALLRLQEIIDGKLDGIRLQFELRDTAVSTALEAQKEAMTRLASSVVESVSRLQELHNERFDSIAIQFRERDTRTEQTSKDGKVAIDAALQAQKEAVGKQNESNAQAIAKSEAAFVKQIDQIGTLIATMAKSTDDKIGDIKDRLTTIEGLKKGATDVWAYMIAIAAVAIAVVSLFIKH